MKQMFNVRILYVIEHSVCAYLNILIIVECLKIQAIIILVKLIILRHYTFLNKYTIHATYLGRFIKNAQLVSRLSKVGLVPTFVPPKTKIRYLCKNTTNFMMYGDSDTQ